MKKRSSPKKNLKIIFSCIIRKSSVNFYSKLTVEELSNIKLNLRDIRNIDHYTSHLPTEIVIKEIDQLDYLLKYFDRVYEKFYEKF